MDIYPTPLAHISLSTVLALIFVFEIMIRPLASAETVMDDLVGAGNGAMILYRNDGFVQDI